MKLKVPENNKILFTR